MFLDQKIHGLDLQWFSTQKTNVQILSDALFVQDYTITLYLNQYWRDERLAFSNADEQMTLTGDFAEKIWVPDTFFANDKNR